MLAKFSKNLLIIGFLLASCYLSIVSLGLLYAWHHNEITLQWLPTDNTQLSVLDGAVVRFNDAGGHKVASGVVNNKGLLDLEHPAAGICHEKLSAQDYKICNTLLSEWISQWVSEANTISIAYGDCKLDNIPLALTSNVSGIWTWFLPWEFEYGIEVLPEWRYQALIGLDVSSCTLSDAPQPDLN